MTPAGVVAWEGPSLFTGRPVRVVLSCLKTPSANPKTGAMVQASVIQADVNPSLARGTERERDVCGDCPGSALRQNWCYTRPLSWLLGQQMERWSAVPLEEGAALLAGRRVRLGAYGDPAAVPFGVWAALVARADAWTGYTHAWRTCDQRFRKLLMASVDSHPAAIDAELAGWRYFRIRHPKAPLLMHEVVCLNEDRGSQCFDCLFCDGERKGAKHVVITVHGQGAGNFGRRSAA